MRHNIQAPHSAAHRTVSIIDRNNRIDAIDLGFVNLIILDVYLIAIWMELEYNVYIIL